MLYNITNSYLKRKNKGRKWRRNWYYYLKKRKEYIQAGLDILKLDLSNQKIKEGMSIALNLK